MRTKNMKNERADLSKKKIIKMAAILEFLAAILETCWYLGEFFYLKMLLENVITLF